MQYLLAHDLGTSGNKAVLYAEDGTLLYSVTKNYDLKVEHANWCEQDAEDWWGGGRCRHSGDHRKISCEGYRRSFLQWTDDGRVGGRFQGESPA